MDRSELYDLNQWDLYIPLKFCGVGNYVMIILTSFLRVPLTSNLCFDIGSWLGCRIVDEPSAWIHFWGKETT